MSRIKARFLTQFLITLYGVEWGRNFSDMSTLENIVIGSTALLLITLNAVTFSDYS